jgi:hypothetical protein
MKKLLAISTLICVFQALVFGQSFELKTNKDLIAIGEHVELTMTINSIEGALVEFPQLTDTLVKNIEILETGSIDTIQNQNGAFSFIQKLILTSFDSGYYAISPRYAKINGDSFASNPILLGVQTLDIDTSSQYFDIKGVAESDISIMELIEEYWPWLAGFVAIAALITFIVLRFSKKKEQVIIEIPKPKIPPHIIAIERLEKLKEKQLWQEGKTKAYYIELTEVLRWFIEQRFGVYALEQTTDEIMTSLRRLPNIKEEDKESVYRLLFLADLVKFAKEKPVGSENEQYFEMTKSFVASYKTSLQNIDKHDA